MLAGDGVGVLTDVGNVACSVTDDVVDGYIAGVFAAIATGTDVGNGACVVEDVVAVFVVACVVVTDVVGVAGVAIQSFPSV